MTYGNSGYGTGNAAVLDVQVAGADTSQGDTHQGITRVKQFGKGLFNQRKFPFSDISIC